MLAVVPYSLLGDKGAVVPRVRARLAPEAGKGAAHRRTNTASGDGVSRETPPRTDSLGVFWSEVEGRYTRGSRVVRLADRQGDMGPLVLEPGSSCTSVTIFIPLHPLLYARCPPKSTPFGRGSREQGVGSRE